MNQVALDYRIIRNKIYALALDAKFHHIKYAHIVTVDTPPVPAANPIAQHATGCIVSTLRT